MIHKSCRGFTLIELMMSAAVSAFVIAALFVAAITMQKSFAATEDYSVSKCDQMRLTDFIALDLRRALTVTPGSDGVTLLTITIPDYYDGQGQPRTPTIAGQTVNYGDPANPVQVSYKKIGSTIQRQLNNSPPQEIAVNVDNFKITLQDLNKVVKTQITFAPKFQSIETQDARVATTVHNTTLLRNKRRDQL
jgi:prepilin-type N-terminal cleavage/methylation domain-containing protein